MDERRLFRALVLPAIGLLLSLQVFAQTRTITGRVTDATGKGVAGVTVSVNGTSAATTDENGAYTISAANGASLVFSSVGFERRELTVGEQTNVSVTLQTATANLGEVVVVGYGTQRRRDLTGSITTVTSKDFQKGVIPTPEQLIAGKVAGVQITSNGGAPGAGSTIRIRGGASLNASNDPLIVVDGVPLTAGGINGAANPLALINPNDIESMNVLKDASATAIYGSRASNGVIIITTKKGTSGKPQVSFNTQLSASENTRRVEVLNADQFRELVNARGNADQKALLGTANTNWQDQIYRTAFSQDNNLSVRGSLGRMPYRASVGFLNQDGVLKTGNMKRTSGSLSLSPRFFDEHLRVDINLKGAVTNNQFADQAAIGNAVTFDPTQPVTNGGKRYGGYFEWLLPGSGLPNLNAPRNPVGLLNQRDDKSTVQRSIGNAQFDYKFHFLPELRANVNLGYDISEGRGTVFVPDSAAAQYNRKGQNTEYKRGYVNTLFEAYLNYVKDLKNIDSRIDVMAGYSYQDFLTKYYNYADFNARGEKIPGSDPIFATDEPRYTLLSYYGRLNYGYKGRYLLTATVRRDGSSRFAEANRWGVFPSLALAWNVKDEAFLRNVAALSNLKFRVSYGVTGQQEGINYYDYISYYNLSGNTARYQLGNTFYNMYRPGGYYANRKWEETTTWNAGLDYGFLGNRISGTLDVYYRETNDLLNEISQSAGTNFSNRIVANVGSMINKGIEFTLNTTPVRTKEWSWDLNYNITLNKNEISQLTMAPSPSYVGNEYGGVAGGTGNTIQINSVNYPRGAFYTYQQVYNEAGKPIENLFVDRNKDGVINNSDRYQYKQADPQVFMGLSSNVGYRKWNAGFIARANFGNYVYNNLYSNLGRFSTVGGLPNILNNASVNILESGFTGGNVNQLLSDYYIQNASFLRMDNINLGYNVGKVLRTANLRLSATVMNAFVITKYKGLDPEISGGIDNNFYPRPRTYVLGVNLDF
ncbi:iron complex outermembrane recepter protein [Cnuella takakiae]|uniref:Iron complex outermembrane recepter protein n=1 Tax=Cnuella takakiae TaxID=1302690 RepID=A0A1M5H767_9BACT|nr:TonB-dependent receptor [Cnuella takakiae]OLY91088.1 SusC/RagA family protein [Cnuella takakiae]SHG11755.1 iron complex outermembrane recepter protein [Cnuella takakiae]